MGDLAIDGGTPAQTTMLDYRRGAFLIGDEEQAAVAAVLRGQSLVRCYGPGYAEAELADVAEAVAKVTKAVLG